MKEHQTSRTLLKSPPELWAECSDAQSLAKHLGESVGEIRITSLEPESTVAWEGDRASGTVKLEPSGWGTRVTLTCSTDVREEVPPEREPEPEAHPASVEPAAQRASVEPTAQTAPTEPAANTASSAEQPPAPSARGGLFARMMRFLAAQRDAPEPLTAEPQAPDPPPSAAEAAPSEEPMAPERPAPAQEPPALEAAVAGPPEADESPEVLAAALDSLGQAHHRPFSRA